MDRRIFLATGSALAIALSVGGSPVTAADFKGKTITMVIPFGVGGGADVWGRFNASLLQKHLPGQPVVIVRNAPGAGSVSGANLFAATAKPDGLTILGTSGSTQFPYLLGESRVRFDYRDWIPVLAASTGGVAYISAKLGAKSLKDLGKLKGVKLHYASQGLTSLDLVPLLGFRLLGLDVQHVTGFPGRGEGRMAFERGEMNIDYQTTSAYLRSAAPLVKSGQAVALFSWGVLDKAGNLARDPNFPDLPHFEEAYEIVFGKKPSGTEWEAMRAFLVAGFPGQKLLVLPKGTPPDIVEAYRMAVRNLVKDPEYIAKRDDLIGEYDQLTDEEGEQLYKAATTISPEARNWVRDYLTKNYDVKFPKE
ncbi:MAG: tripartite tricarboxylate transporter substrate-binding protein [Beijerinckiaceae bacterium]|nr:tripartite tricarboxylate transporter substrate-binding protein [Beijerinckiaceae bacterium]